MLIAPTYGPAWKSDLALGDHVGAASPITKAPSMAGWPIATAPMGLVDGLPVGLGAVGRPGSEGLVVGAVPGSGAALAAGLALAGPWLGKVRCP